MTIGITARQVKRWGLLAMAATLGWAGDATTAFAANGPGILDRKPSGPIFKTLDAFAGGIELVLEKTVLKNTRKKHGCDSQSCDDGCDTIMLHELSMPPGSKVAVPEAYQPQPAAESRLEKVPPESVPPMIEVEPTFDRPVRKVLPEPMPESIQPPVPKSDMPPVFRTPVQKKLTQPNLSTDDRWIDNFAPSTPNPNAAPQRRAPVPVKEALPDPFQDDPQTRSMPRRLLPSLHPSEPSHATRPPVLRAVSPVSFER